MDLGLRNRRALVTGGSRGIGRATALALAQEGAHVALCARNEGPLKQTADDLAAHGVTAFWRAVDVADGDALRGFVGEAAEALGGLDVFVNNASASVVQEPGDAAWETSFRTDLLAFVHALEAVVPVLQQSDAASIVSVGTTASLESFVAGPNSFVAVKAAVVQHTLNQAAALAASGIRCNVVSPGAVWVEGGSWNMIKDHMTEIYDATCAQIPLGNRLTTDEEVARAIVFLASPAAGHVTGANLVVDGGFTKRFDW